MIDIRVQDEGSIHVLYPETNEGRDWLDWSFPTAPRWCGGFVCGHSYIADVVAGALCDGVVIERE